MENAIGLSVMFAVFVLLPVFGFAVSPLCFVFTDEFVEIVYNFGQRERIKWADIRSISIMGSWLGGGGGSPRYVLAYPRTEKRLFFVVGEINKTAKTKKKARRKERYFFIRWRKLDSTADNP
jgi:hypothetical protein